MIAIKRFLVDGLANETWFMRSLRMGVNYVDVIPFTIFVSISSCLLNWIREAENIPDNPRAPFGARVVTRIRRWLFAALSVFVDFTEQPNNINDDMFSNRFNLGILFTLLFAIKFLSM